MINRIKTFFLGARTVKTGIAVGLSIFISGHVPFSMPILAGVAAVICIQPSLTAGVKKGFDRIQTTIIAGLFGLAFYFALGANVITIGLAVILLIALFSVYRIIFDLEEITDALVELAEASNAQVR